MGVQMEYDSKNESYKHRPLSSKTGYLYLCFLYLQQINEKLKYVLQTMAEHQPWFDSDEEKNN